MGGVGSYSTSTIWFMPDFAESQTMMASLMGAFSWQRNNLADANAQTTYLSSKNKREKSMFMGFACFSTKKSRDLVGLTFCSTAYSVCGKTQSNTDSPILVIVIWLGSCRILHMSKFMV